MALRLIIDSASDITVNEANEHGWTLIPLTVTIGGTEYRDGVDITPDRFYDMLVESDDLPHTSQLTPADYEKAIEEVIAAGDTPLHNHTLFKAFRHLSVRLHRSGVL